MGAGAGVSDGGKSVAVGKVEDVGSGDGKRRSSLSVKVTSVTLSANATGRCGGFCVAVNVSIDQTAESLPQSNKVGDECFS